MTTVTFTEQVTITEMLTQGAHADEWIFIGSAKDNLIRNLAPAFTPDVRDSLVELGLHARAIHATRYAPGLPAPETVFGWAMGRNWTVVPERQP